MPIDHALLIEFIANHPFQPATAFWRAVEVTHISSYPFPAGRGLDLGCGDGQLTKILLNIVGDRELVGVDIDPRETAMAGRLGIYKKVYAVSAGSIPEKDGAFDFVFSNSVLEHIEDMDSLIKEVSRLTKPGGTFLFTVPGERFHAVLKGPLNPFLKRADYLKNLDKQLSHKRYWGAAQWDGFLARNGLQLEQVTEYLNRHEARRWENIVRFTSGILCGLIGRKKQPIEIQHALGLRRTSAKIPRPAARLFSYLLMHGIEKNGYPKEANGCLMIRCKRQ
jgi:SAM-dependent methyltransferase